MSFRPVKTRLSSAKTCQASTWATWAAGDNRTQIIFQSLKKMGGGAERRFWWTPELVDMLHHFLDVQSVPSSSLELAQAKVQAQELRHHSQQDQQHNDEGSTCCVCLDLPPQVVLVPCGHMNLCWDCACLWKRKPQKGGGGVCPNCRTPIDFIQKFVPLH